MDFIRRRVIEKGVRRIWKEVSDRTPEKTEFIRGTQREGKTCKKTGAFYMEYREVYSSRPSLKFNTEENEIRKKISEKTPGRKSPKKAQKTEGGWGAPKGLLFLTHCLRPRRKKVLTLRTGKNTLKIENKAVGWILGKKKTALALHAGRAPARTLYIRRIKTNHMGENWCGNLNR